MGEVNPLIPLSAQPTIVDEDLFFAQAIRQVKDNWTSREMLAREALYCNFDDITMFVGTWNVHGSEPTEGLNSWLSSIGDPDLVVIG